MADLTLYRAYLRELDFDVFSLLFKTMSLETELQVKWHTIYLLLSLFLIFCDVKTVSFTADY